MMVIRGLPNFPRPGAVTLESSPGVTAEGVLSRLPPPVLWSRLWSRGSRRRSPPGA